MLEQEAVELGFGQRVGALLFDRVLGRDHHEVLAQIEALAVDRDLALLHGFQQGRLRLGRGAVDFVGQQEVGEDRALHQREGVVLEREEIGAEQVTGQQVRRELDAPELEADARREALREKRLGRARHAFEQDVAA